MNNPIVAGENSAITPGQIEDLNTFEAETTELFLDFFISVFNTILFKRATNKNSSFFFSKKFFNLELAFTFHPQVSTYIEDCSKKATSFILQNAVDGLQLNLLTSTNIVVQRFILKFQGKWTWANNRSSESENVYVLESVRAGLKQILVRLNDPGVSLQLPQPQNKVARFVITFGFGRNITLDTYNDIIEAAFKEDPDTFKFPWSNPKFKSLNRCNSLPTCSPERHERRIGLSTSPESKITRDSDSPNFEPTSLGILQDELKFPTLANNINTDGLSPKNVANECSSTIVPTLFPIETAILARCLVINLYIITYEELCENVHSEWKNASDNLSQSPPSGRYLRDQSYPSLGQNFDKRTNGDNETYRNENNIRNIQYHEKKENSFCASTPRDFMISRRTSPCSQGSQASTTSSLADHSLCRPIEKIQSDKSRKHRMDPVRLLGCLTPMIDITTGAIMSEKVIPTMLSLMSKFSKKMVSKCSFINILNSTSMELLDKFLEGGGWLLLQKWTTEGIEKNNFPLIVELLMLLLRIPVNAKRLKENNLRDLVKRLSTWKADGTIRSIALRITTSWDIIVNQERSVLSCLPRRSLNSNETNGTRRHNQLSELSGSKVLHDPSNFGLSNAGISPNLPNRSNLQKNSKSLDGQAQNVFRQNTSISESAYRRDLKNVSNFQSQSELEEIPADYLADVLSSSEADPVSFSFDLSLFTEVNDAILAIQESPIHSISHTFLGNLQIPISEISDRPVVESKNPSTVANIEPLSSEVMFDVVNSDDSFTEVHEKSNGEKLKNSENHLITFSESLENPKPTTENVQSNQPNSAYSSCALSENIQQSRLSVLDSKQTAENKETNSSPNKSKDLPETALTDPEQAVEKEFTEEDCDMLLGLDSAGWGKDFFVSNEIEAEITETLSKNMEKQKHPNPNEDRNKRPRNTRRKKEPRILFDSKLLMDSKVIVIRCDHPKFSSKSSHEDRELKSVQTEGQGNENLKIVNCLKPGDESPKHVPFPIISQVVGEQVRVPKLQNTETIEDFSRDTNDKNSKSHVTTTKPKNRKVSDEHANAKSEASKVTLDENCETNNKISKILVISPTKEINSVTTNITASIETNNELVGEVKVNNSSNINKHEPSRKSSKLREVVDKREELNIGKIVSKEQASESNESPLRPRIDIVIEQKKESLNIEEIAPDDAENSTIQVKATKITTDAAVFEEKQELVSNSDILNEDSSKQILRKSPIEPEIDQTQGHASLNIDSAEENSNQTEEKGQIKSRIAEQRAENELARNDDNVEDNNLNIKSFKSKSDKKEEAICGFIVEQTSEKELLSDDKIVGKKSSTKIHTTPTSPDFVEQRSEEDSPIIDNFVDKNASNKICRKELINPDCAEQSRETESVIVDEEKNNMPRQKQSRRSQACQNASEDLLITKVIRNHRSTENAEKVAELVETKDEKSTSELKSELADTSYQKTKAKKTRKSKGLSSECSSNDNIQNTKPQAPETLVNQYQDNSGFSFPLDFFNDSESEIVSAKTLASIIPVPWLKHVRMTRLKPEQIPDRSNKIEEPLIEEIENSVPIIRRSVRRPCPKVRDDYVSDLEVKYQLSKIQREAIEQKNSADNSSKDKDTTKIINISDSVKDKVDNNVFPSTSTSKENVNLVLPSISEEDAQMIALCVPEFELNSSDESNEDLSKRENKSEGTPPHNKSEKQVGEPVVAVFSKEIKAAKLSTSATKVQQTKESRIEEKVKKAPRLIGPGKVGHLADSNSDLLLLQIQKAKQESARRAELIKNLKPSIHEKTVKGEITRNKGPKGISEERDARSYTANNDPKISKHEAIGSAKEKMSAKLPKNLCSTILKTAEAEKFNFSSTSAQKSTKSESKVVENKATANADPENKIHSVKSVTSKHEFTSVKPTNEAEALSAKATSNSAKVSPPKPSRSSSFIDMIGIPGAVDQCKIKPVVKSQLKSQATSENQISSADSNLGNEIENSEKVISRPKVFVSKRSRADGLLDDMTKSNESGAAISESRRQVELERSLKKQRKEKKRQKHRSSMSDSDTANLNEMQNSAVSTISGSEIIPTPTENDSNLSQQVQSEKSKDKNNEGNEKKIKKFKSSIEQLDFLFFKKDSEPEPSKLSRKDQSNQKSGLSGEKQGFDKIKTSETSHSKSSNQTTKVKLNEDKILALKEKAELDYQLRLKTLKKNFHSTVISDLEESRKNKPKDTSHINKPPETPDHQPEVDSTISTVEIVKKNQPIMQSCVFDEVLKSNAMEFDDYKYQKFNRKRKHKVDKHHSSKLNKTETDSPVSPPEVTVDKSPEPELNEELPTYNYSNTNNIEGGVRSILILHGEQRRKKSVRWRNHDLVATRYFELDSSERVNVARMDFAQRQKLEKVEEKKLLKSNLNSVGQEKLWTPPRPIIFDPGQPVPVVNSREIIIQEEREKGELAVIYFWKTQIPDSAKEPDPEEVEKKSPIIIPEDGPRSLVKDFSNINCYDLVKKDQSVLPMPDKHRLEHRGHHKSSSFNEKNENRKSEKKQHHSVRLSPPMTPRYDSDYREKSHYHKNSSPDTSRLNDEKTVHRKKSRFSDSNQPLVQPTPIIHSSRETQSLIAQAYLQPSPQSESYNSAQSRLHSMQFNDQPQLPQPLYTNFQYAPAPLPMQDQFPPFPASISNSHPHLLTGDQPFSNQMEFGILNHNSTINSYQNYSPTEYQNPVGQPAMLQNSNYINYPQQIMNPMPFSAPYPCPPPTAVQSIPVPPPSAPCPPGSQTPVTNFASLTSKNVGPATPARDPIKIVLRQPERKQIRRSSSVFDDN